MYDIIKLGTALGGAAKAAAQAGVAGGAEGEEGEEGGEGHCADMIMGGELGFL